MKKTLAILLFIAAFAWGQEEPVDPCEDYLADSEDTQLCRDYYDLLAERDALLKIQQDWNNAAANTRRNHYNGLITKWEAKKAALTGNKRDLESHIQAKIDRLVRLRDEYDRIGDPENPGPRDKAEKLGPKISALNQLINDIRQELNIKP